MAKASSSKKPAASPASQNKPAPNTEPALMALFIDEIKDIYWAENHLVKALPKMQKAATSAELADAIGEHLEVTKTHVTRLEQVFELLGQPALAKKCDAMEGLSKEGEAIIETTEDGSATRDAGIIIASQKVEHYEIATYGSLAQVAKTLGLTEVAALLGETLAEEKEADETLSRIAENEINYEASGESA